MNKLLNPAIRSQHLRMLCNTLFVRKIFSCLPLCWLLIGATVATGVEPLEVSHLSLTDPSLPVDWLADPSDPIVPIDLKNLDDSRPSIRLETARSCIYAKQQSRRLPPGTLNKCIEKLNQGEADPAVKESLLTLVVMLGSVEHAQIAWKNADSPHCRSMVEEALIQWKSKIALEQWRQRAIELPADRSQWGLAISGLGAVGEAKDIELLTTLIQSDRLTKEQKIVVARSLGMIANEGLDTIAANLIQATSTESTSAREGACLLPALLLRSHTNERSLELLKEIISKGDGPSRCEAYATLAKVDRDGALKLTSTTLLDKEMQVRLVSVGLTLEHGSEEQLRFLGQQLGDGNEQVRRAIRVGLLAKWDDAKLRGLVEESVTRALNGNWQAKEQGILIAAAIGMKSTIPRIIDLLEDPNPTVYVTAAWGLRVLVSEEEHLEKITAFIKLWTEKFFFGTPYGDSEYHRVSHLLELVGIQKYAPAEPLLRRYLAKNPIAGLMTRVSAIWGVGRYWEGKKEPALGQTLAGIIADKNRMNAEPDIIRYSATLAVGWIADRDNESALDVNDEPVTIALGMATQWSRQRIAAASEKE